MIRYHGMQFMQDLKKLQEFHFEIVPHQEEKYNNDDELTGVEEWVYSWCAQNLPQLKLIGDTFDTEHFYQVVPAFSGTSSLETLHSTSFLPEANLPNLKQLRFCGDIDDSNLFPKLCSYKNLTTLVLNGIKAKEFDQILELIGEQLSHLSVTMSNVNVFLLMYGIFHFCPNLVKVELELESITNSPAILFQELVSAKNFLCLEEFHCGYMNPDMTLPAGILKLILQAPLIRNIHVEYFSLTMEDCIWLKDVIEGRFQRLETVSFESLRLAPGCKIEDLGQIVKFLVSGAQKLSSFQIDWDDLDCREDWNEKQPGVIKFLELLP